MNVFERAVKLVFIGLLFCSATATADDGVTFVSENVRFTVYAQGDEARLVLSDGRVYDMALVQSASGARYAGGAVEFWSKGETALLILGDETYRVRAVDEKTDLWLRARAEGVDFRAMGQEPGWLLELREKKEITLQLDYGRTRVTTPVTSMEMNYAENTTMYRSGPPLSPFSIVVTVRQDVCYDVMSGEGFTSSVTVELEAAGRTYEGCGRRLSR